MLTRTLLTRTLPSAASLTRQALPRVVHTTIHRQTATFAIQLPAMAFEPLTYFRETRPTSAAETAAETMATGKLVSDEIVAAMLESYLRTNAHDGWVLDGFPRNATQAEMLLSKMETTPDLVIELVVSHDDIRERLMCRRVDPLTGAVYSIAGEMPGDADVISRLERRADDNEEVIERRLRVYEESMPAVRNVFKAHGVRVVQVKAERGASVEEVREEIEKVANGKRIVIAGAPGCGKGTQGVILAEFIGGEHVSTGDLLRKAARLARDGLAGIVGKAEPCVGVVARL